jgi:hypothetical protein
VDVPPAQAAPSYRGAAGFDFWLGEWDCTFANGSAVNRITRILGDQVIHEDFRSAGLNGQSVSVFDEQRQLWMQTWVDDQNGYLLFVGQRDVERMILVGRRPDGALNGMRMVWDEITGDAFSWDYQKQSADGAWSSQWKIAYRRRP